MHSLVSMGGENMNKSWSMDDPELKPTKLQKSDPDEGLRASDSDGVLTESYKDPQTDARDQ